MNTAPENIISFSWIEKNMFYELFETPVQCPHIFLPSPSLSIVDVTGTRHPVCQVARGEGGWPDHNTGRHRQSGTQAREWRHWSPRTKHHTLHTVSAW